MLHARRLLLAGLALFLLVLSPGLPADDAKLRPAFSGRLGLDVLDAHGVALAAVDHRGRPAVRALHAPDFEGETFAVVRGASFRDGTIDVDVAGQPAPGAREDARGFIGIAFRVSADLGSFECFYLRPTNGRADDQLRRNHATQYVSEPEFPWHRLRKEFPGVYESYVDLETGAWTHLRVEVSGRRARLYVNGAAQPALLVNDLKHEPAAGQVALWIGGGTEGYFSNLGFRSP